MPTPPARRWRPALAVLILAGGATAWAVYGRQTPPPPGPKAGRTVRAGAVAVEVVAPKPGGIVRTCTQPGTVEPSRANDLFAKVSGFLAEQTVDIGSRVKKGQVLARIAVPEFDKQVARDEARLENARARVRQAEAKLTAARAEARSSQALVAFAEAESKSKAAYTSFRKKQFERIRELNEKQAIDARLVDEKEDQYEAAQGAEFASKEQVASSRAAAEAAAAKIGQAQADLEEAKSEVNVAAADLEKSKVWVEYATLTAPFDGVITRRNFYPPSAFIRSAEAGGTVPLLTVERTDPMLVVVQVPDRDVPYTAVGNDAVIEIDALERKLHYRAAAKVARKADAEDPSTRTMRVEIEVPNPNGDLARGMYGRTTIILDKGTPGAMHLPTAALVDRKSDGTAAVRVVRDGKARVVPVKVGTDSGIEVEVVGELTPRDQVIVRAAGPVADGTEVVVSEATAGH